MTKEEAISQLEQLVKGEIEEIRIKKEDFITFRDIWYAHPEKNHIVGEALLGGEAIYRHHKDEK